MEFCRKLCLLAFLVAMNMADIKVVNKRHTPFLPGDYWKDRRPEFGDTNTDVEVMVNGTARLKCPISHVADSSVRNLYFHIIFLKL